MRKKLFIAGLSLVVSAPWVHAIPKSPAPSPLKLASATTVIAEAEEFTPVKGRAGWRARNWGENYYAATLANTFLSRKAFLGAPEETTQAVASREIEVPSSGQYLALVRYEAAPRFETQFTLRIEQNGKVWQRLYGARENVKIWAFGEKLKKEALWSWGDNEDIVWEGHDASIELEAGPARLTLIAAAQPKPAARRNVDVVMLTRDEADVKNRIEKENYLPLDGLLTQSGDLWMQVWNHGMSPLSIKVNPGTEHSPYWVHLRDWKPKTIEIPVGQASAWVEVGSLLDTLNDGQWKIDAGNTALSDRTPLKYDIVFGVPQGAGIRSIRELKSQSDSQLALAYFADTRYDPRVIEEREVLFDLLAGLKKQKVRGVAPQRSLIYGYTFGPKPADPQYEAARREFIGLIGANAMVVGQKPGFEDQAGPPRGYLDVGHLSNDLPQLETYLQQLQKEGTASRIAVVTLGDEISLPLPPKDDAGGFRDWLLKCGFNPADLQKPGAAVAALAWDNTATAKTANPALYYLSNRYLHDYGIQRLAAVTQLVRRYLPQAQVGANFSPHHGVAYLGEAHKWARLFREGGMTMPWSEDYIWQIPAAGQQINSYNIDLFRAGLKNKPGSKIHMYVMAHVPGNTPESWRRLFYGDIALGVKIFNLYELRPVQASYTENYCNSPAMYQEIRKSLYELGTFEDIVQDGKVRPAQTALWCGETGDVWGDSGAPYGAARRSLYSAIRNRQVPLDMVLEEDALDGSLANYKVVYLTDRHVNRAASQALVAWVQKGGKLFATAGAGQRDEDDKPNEILGRLFGISETRLEESPAAIVYEKQDLPFAQPVDSITLQKGKALIPAFGAVSRISANSDTVVTARFSNAAPALTVRASGLGQAFYCAFLPGLSYFKPAIPMKPLDRAGEMAHLLPNTFDMAAGDVIGLPAKDLSLPVSCSNTLVENTVIDSPNGMLISLINWSGKPQKQLKVRMTGPLPFKSISLAGGGKVRVMQDGSTVVVTLSLDVADMLIVRR